MKKIILIILSMFMLMGCTNENDNKNILINDLKELAHDSISFINNHSKKLYSYYVIPSMTSDSINDTSSIIKYEDKTITLNIEVNNILNQQLYSNEDKVKQLKIKGTRVLMIDDLLIDYNNEPVNYYFEIYRLNDEYLLSLRTKFFILESIQKQSDVEIIAKMMMTVAKSVNIDIDQIILDYSNKIEIYTEKEVIELYKPLAPENGPISEILADSQIKEYLDNVNGESPDEVIPDTTPEASDDEASEDKE